MTDIYLTISLSTHNGDDTPKDYGINTSQFDQKHRQIKTLVKIPNILSLLTFLNMFRPDWVIFKGLILKHI
jgi:hypothetical protein